MVDIDNVRYVGGMYQIIYKTIFKMAPKEALTTEENSFLCTFTTIQVQDCSMLIASELQLLSRPC